MSMSMSINIYKIVITFAVRYESWGKWLLKTCNQIIIFSLDYKKNNKLYYYYHHHQWLKYSGELLLLGKQKENGNGYKKRLQS